MLKICAYLQIKPRQAEQKKAQTCEEIYKKKKQAISKSDKRN
jgi:hypothetical protein